MILGGSLLSRRPFPHNFIIFYILILVGFQTINEGGKEGKKERRKERQKKGKKEGGMEQKLYNFVRLFVRIRL